MAPRFSVTVARRCDPRVKALRGEVKQHFDRAVEELRHRGCEAGGIRMRADTGADHRVCERRFYRDWRVLVEPADDLLQLHRTGEGADVSDKMTCVRDVSRSHLDARAS